MDDSERLKRLSIRVVLLEQRLDEIASLRSGEQRMLSVEGEAVIDWSAVLRAASRRLAGIGATVTASAGVAISHALEGAADELERQRDAAQGAMRETASDIGPAASPETPRPPASSARDEIATLLLDHVAVMPGRYGWLNAAEAVLAMEAGWRAESDALRAQLAEREAELAALRSLCWGPGLRTSTTAKGKP